MVTTEPNEYAAKFHDRMPVILDEADAPLWLGDQPLDDARLLALCRGQPSAALQHEDQPAVKKITKAELKSQGELEMG